MANKTATLTIDCAYTGPGGTTVAAPRKTVSAPYQAETIGDIDIPAGATAGSTQTIPFGSIATEATLAMVHNGTTQTMTLKVNGATACSLAAGGAAIVGGPTVSGGSDPLTAITLHPSTTQAAVATCSYWVFGDPS